MDARKIRARDAAARRLRLVTAGAVAGAGVLALGFASLAARAFPGGTSSHTPVQRTVKHVAVATNRGSQATPPALVPVNVQAAPPASQPAAPVQTPAAPVAVSGGS